MTSTPKTMTMAGRIGRFVALPILSAGIIGGAAVGLAGAANAAAVVTPAPSPAIVAVPQTTAEPATDATPGWWWHRHHPSLLDPSAAANFTYPGM